MGKIKSFDDAQEDLARTTKEDQQQKLDFPDLKTAKDFYQRELDSKAKLHGLSLEKLKSEAQSFNLPGSEEILKLLDISSELNEMNDAQFEAMR